MRWIILIFGFVLFGWGGYLAFLGNNTGAGVMCSAGSVCLIFAFLARFKKIKGPWIEAELWEDKMEEAEEVIKSLQSLSIAVSKPIISTITKMGRWGGVMSNRDKFETVKQFKDILKGHNVPEDKIEESLRDWHSFNVIDLAALILKDISEHVKEKQKPIQTQIAGYPTPINAGDPTYKSYIDDLRTIGKAAEKIKPIYSLETPEEILNGLESILNDSVIFTDGERNEFLDTHKEEIEDLRYYVKNMEFRRLGHWLSKDEKKE